MLTLPAAPGRLAGPGRTVRLFLVRGTGPDFSEADRALLTLLRPHLHQAYLDAERRRHPVPELTGRQWQLLDLLAGGHTNAQIARRLGLSEGTVRTHLENIYRRLQVSSRTAAVSRAFPNRDFPLTSPPWDKRVPGSSVKAAPAGETTAGASTCRALAAGCTPPTSASSTRTAPGRRSR
jgi:DNA-binding CsgD family transcriptional regulator